ncbi:MAG: hypothetical protein IPP12_02460 [Nitrospira sp.]|jgi:hypothetical protein|nr:hypothetical protein [Nitrospira sp.]MBK9946038.1 hypothetical protein [Nitrospira sp.]MBL8052680.1 hypothetical protein [Nitrospira sp.]
MFVASTVLQALFLLLVLVGFPDTSALSGTQNSEAPTNDTGQFEYNVRNIVLTTYPGYGPKSLITATLVFKIRNITTNDVRVALISGSDTTIRLESGLVMPVEHPSSVSGVSVCQWAIIRNCEPQADNYTMIRGGKNLSGVVKFQGNLAGNRLGAPVVATLSGQLFVQDLKSGKAWLEPFTVDDIPLQNDSGQ